jgi:hypothetical protein
MAHTIPTTEPAQLRAGDLATWTKSLADYPASAGWVLSYALVKSGTRITFSASASGDDHLVAVPAATTASWAAGTYTWAARVTKTTEIYTVATGTFDILPDIAAAVSGLDARSHAVKTLEALETWLESHDPAVAEYEIAGRRMKYIPVGELLKLRDAYRREVSVENTATRLAAGLPARNKLQVRL